MNLKSDMQDLKLSPSGKLSLSGTKCPIREMDIILCSFSIFFLFSFTTAGSAKDKKSGSPVSIYSQNPYYFQDTKGKPFMFIGDYTWETFSGKNFDYEKMFDALKSRGLNLARVWLWWGCEELPAGDGFPDENKLHIEPFLREGPGLANDGKPKYNLDKFNPAFFERLVHFCKAADRRGITLQLMMMDAWMLKKGHLWPLHAFNRNNNVNKVDGDPNNTGKGIDGQQGFCSMGNPRAMEYQKAYIRKVVETVNRFRNIYFEIANENFYSEEWELALCDFIKTIELEMPNQHMTIRRDFPSHHYVVQKWDPLTVHQGIMEKRTLSVPLLFDTDWEINENDDEVRKAAWSAVASGGHFSYMDDAMLFRTDTVIKDKRAALHKQIDYIAGFMKKLKPWDMTPDDSPVKSGLSFAMASKNELFAYLPAGGEVVLDLSAMEGRTSARWYNPLNGKYGKKFRLTATQPTTLQAPDENDWVLLIKSKCLYPHLKGQTIAAENPDR